MNQLRRENCQFQEKYKGKTKDEGLDETHI